MQQGNHQMKGGSMGNNRNDGHSSKQSMHIQPNIGLDREIRQSVVDLLNQVLADEVILTSKIRSAHWNIHGAGFFELHTLFKHQYQLLNNISDEIAERARMLGGVVIGSLEQFLSHTRLDEKPGEVLDILRLLADYETSIRFLRDDTRKCSEEYEDQGTVELLVRVMCLHEKMAWMLRSYVEGEPSDHKDLLI
jgi:starvation-inducible DNA-binding protein